MSGFFRALSRYFSAADGSAPLEKNGPHAYSNPYLHDLKSLDVLHLFCSKFNTGAVSSMEMLALKSRLEVTRQQDAAETMYADSLQSNV